MAAPGTTAKTVRILLSKDRREARLRALSLYKAWVRLLPFVDEKMRLLLTPDQIKAKIRAEFYKNAHITDLRVIDALVFQGQLDYQETATLWAQPCHLMNRWQTTRPKKPSTFLAKFFAGSD